MPRNLDLYRKYAQVTNNPLNTLSAQQLAAIIAQPQPNLAQIEAQAVEDSINNLLTLIDDGTGLNLLSWAQSLEGSFSGNLLTDLMDWLSGDTTTSSGQWIGQAIIDDIVHLFNPSAGTGNPPTSIGTTGQNSLAGLLTSIFDNGDGTGSIVSGIEDLGDGTGKILSGLYTLFDNGDGTAMSVAQRWATFVTNSIDGSQNIVDGLVQLLDYGQVSNATTGNKLEALEATINNGITQLFTPFESIGNLTSPTAWQAFVAGLEQILGLPVSALATTPPNQIQATQIGSSTGLGSLLQDFVSLFQPGQSSIPQENIEPTTAVSATAVSWDAAGAGGSNTGTTYTLSASDSIDIGATANYLIGVAAYVTSTTATSVLSQVVCGSQTMVSLGRVQVPSPGAPYAILEFFALAAPATGSRTPTLTVDAFGKVYAAAIATSSYIGVGAVGMTLFQNTSDTGTTSLTEPVTAATNEMIVQAFYGLSSLSGYGQTQRVYINEFYESALSLLVGDAPGTSSVTTFTATQALAETYAAAAFILAPTGAIIGSGFHAYRTSTTDGGSASDSAQAMPASWYDTTQYISADMSYAPSTNTLTVSHAGWYTITIHQGIGNIPYNNYFVNAVLYQVSGGTTYTRYGPTQFVSSGSTLKWTFGATFSAVYCNAGDTLQPGFFCDATISNMLTGEATGAITYWGVSPINRSLL